VVERKSRRITIHSIEIEEICLPRVTMKVFCSRGTYIRTLCHDIGQKLGCGGAMEKLVRTRSGRFGLEEAYKLSEIQKLSDEGRLEEILMPVENVFEGLLAVQAIGIGQKLLENGNPLECRHVKLLSGETPLDCAPEDGTQVRVYDENGHFTGVYAWRKAEERLKPVKMFLEK